MKIIQVRIRHAEEEVTHAHLHLRKKLKLNTNKGRTDFLQEVMKKHSLAGTGVENYFRLKWLVILKRREWPVTVCVA